MSVWSALGCKETKKANIQLEDKPFYSTVNNPNGEIQSLVRSFTRSLGTQHLPIHLFCICSMLNFHIYSWDCFCDSKLHVLTSPAWKKGKTVLWERSPFRSLLCESKCFHRGPSADHPLGKTGPHLCTAKENAIVLICLCPRGHLPSGCCNI